MKRPAITFFMAVLLSSALARAQPSAATLTLRTDDCGTCGAGNSNPVEIYELLEAWDEGDLNEAPGAASWLERQAGVAWSGAGAEPPSRASVPAATFNPAREDEEYSVSLPAALVQGWVSDPASNHGLTLRIVSDTGAQVIFRASEHGNDGSRPLLTVELEP